MHLTDEQLNEYLDNESGDRTLIEAHLSSCADCAARLSALRVLFVEIESLPELEWAYPIAARFSPSPNLPAKLPRFFALAVTLQAMLTVTIMIVVTPFVIRLGSPFLANVQLPSLANILLQARLTWITWLDTLSTLRLPSLPQTPFLDLSSITVMIALAAVSLLWLVGNGLLLRDRMK